MRRLLGILMLCLASPLVAQGEPPGADDLIRQMSSNLAALESFHFSVTLGFDDVPLPEVKVKYAGSMEVVLQRPNRLRVCYKDELTAREVWIDGETVTVLVPAKGFWASAPAAASINATLNQFAADYGVSIPLDDLLRDDPYSVHDGGNEGAPLCGSLRNPRRALSSPDRRSRGRRVADLDRGERQNAAQTSRDHLQEPADGS